MKVLKIVHSFYLKFKNKCYGAKLGVFFIIFAFIRHKVTLHIEGGRICVSGNRTKIVHELYKHMEK